MFFDMEKKKLDLNSGSPDIQASKSNGIDIKIDALSSNSATVHGNSFNGLRNGSCGHSEICDDVESSVQDPKSETSAPCSPLHGADLLACGAMRASTIAKYAFLFDDKIHDGDFQKNVPTDKSSSVASNQSPDDIGGGNQGISPTSLSNGNQSTGFSTNASSIFTYSLTDESQDELDSGGTAESSGMKCASVTDDGHVTNTEAELSSPVSCSDSKYVDKSTLIKSVIEKVYVHSVTITVEDLLLFQKQKSLVDELSRNDRPTQDSDKTNTPSADMKGFGHKKFSGRSIKKMFKSMSPGSWHRKHSKSSGSLGSRSSSNLGDSTDGVNVKNEPYESVGAEEFFPVADSTREAEKNSPACSSVSDSPRCKMQTRNQPTVDHLKHEASESPASCR